MSSHTDHLYEFGDSQKERLRHAIGALVLVTLFGTCGFMLCEEWNFWRSLYFTLITITTVGYGDYGLSETGEKFTSVLLIAGITTATFAFGQIIQIAVSYQMAWRHRMQKEIDKVSDHYVVCGAGRVGRAVCERFANRSIPFVLIDSDLERCQWARSKGYMTLVGCATHDQTLFDAGLERAKGVICATKFDATNIVITLSAAELNSDVVIVSRANDEDSEHKLKRAGATHVISPSFNGGHDMANLLLQPNLTNFINRSHDFESAYTLAEVTVTAGSSLVGQSFKEFGMTESSLAFIAVKYPNGETRLRPRADDPIEADYVVIVGGKADSVERMMALANPGQGLRAAG